MLHDLGCCCTKVNLGRHARDERRTRPGCPSLGGRQQRQQLEMQLGKLGVAPTHVPDHSAALTRQDKDGVHLAPPSSSCFSSHCAALDDFSRDEADCAVVATCQDPSSTPCRRLPRRPLLQVVIRRGMWILHLYTVLLASHANAMRIA